MAVKIIRQPKKIVLLGSPTSAAGLRVGQERAPAVLRSAGLAARLKSAGFELSDLGDTATYLSEADDEHPRARNVSTILKSLNDLRPRVEIAVKSGALPLILSGDCIPVLATISGTRRYHKHVSLIYVDRDAHLNVPATSASGNVDGMVISQVIGRGAPELVRFWGEPPLVRETDIALFGFERLDPPEEKYLQTSPIRRHSAAEISGAGADKTARLALERVHAAKHEFILNFDVDAITGEEFPWTNFPGSGGLTFDEVRAALRVFVSQTNLAAFNVAGYNPDLDPNGEGAQKLIELLTDVLRTRMETGSGEVPKETEATASSIPDIPKAAEPAPTETPVSESEPGDATPDVTTSDESPESPEPDSFTS